jgi:hypothetical protein
VFQLNTWKSKERQNLPLHLNSLRIHGMQVRNVNARSLQHAYSAFKNFPSKLSISEVRLVPQPSPTRRLLLVVPKHRLLIRI